MKIFIDSANVNDIKEAVSLGVIDGVTTNPTLVAKEKRPSQELLKEICGLVDGPVSAEVISLDADGMIREAQELVKIAPNIVIKIPLIKEGLRAVKILASKKIRTNVTLCFCANQALLAAGWTIQTISQTFRSAEEEAKTLFKAQ
jgi:transaldolase